MCSVFDTPSLNEYAKYFDLLHQECFIHHFRYTCQECIEGLEWVEAYINDPLWVAEYTLNLEENFCPTQAAAERSSSL